MLERLTRTAILAVTIGVSAVFGTAVFKQAYAQQLYENHPRHRLVAVEPKRHDFFGLSSQDSIDSLLPQEFPATAPQMFARGTAEYNKAME